jgi:hypothetical protein
MIQGVKGLYASGVFKRLLSNDFIGALGIF